MRTYYQSTVIQKKDIFWHEKRKLTRITLSMSSAYCKTHTNAYRNCLKDCRDSGRSKTASKTCKPLAVKLDDCREEWRRKNPSKSTAVVSTPKKAEKNAKAKGAAALEGFDGTRILPHPKCRPLSCDVQRCIQWKKGDQSKCQTEIKALKTCMESTTGTVAAATEGDKVWSV